MLAYATPAQLASWLSPGTDDATPPADAARLLREASGVVERYVLAGYAVDDDGLPSDEAIAAALAVAACCQVEFWQVVSEQHDIAGVTSGTMSAGGISHNMPQRPGPRMLDVLDRAGLRMPVTITTRHRRPLDRIGRNYDGLPRLALDSDGVPYFVPPQDSP